MSFNPILARERQHAINGVPGRYIGATVRHDEKPGCFCQQRWISETRPIKGYGSGATLRVEMRFDDDCRNGRNSFAITAEVRRPGARDIEAGGCLHDDIAAVFPELAPLIKWHLMDTDGPMHYVSNTVYLAGDRDSSGKRKGEPSSFSDGIRLGNSPITHQLKPQFLRFLRERFDFLASVPKSNPAAESFAPVAVQHVDDGRIGGYKFGPKFTVPHYSVKWHECPFDTLQEASEFCQAFNTLPVEWVTITTAYSEGKARELESARYAATWPEATDEELSAEPDVLRAALLARLPALLAAFRADIEAAGFFWSPEDVKG